MQVGRFAIKILEKYAYIVLYLREKATGRCEIRFGGRKCDLTKKSSIISFLKKA
jgi:hypothetical protein